MSTYVPCCGLRFHSEFYCSADRFDGRLDACMYSLLLLLLPLLIYRAIQLLIDNVPAMKEMALELLDVIFVPKMIGKQLVLAVALQTGMVRAV
jgi:hypothetical protein